MLTNTRVSHSSQWSCWKDKRWKLGSEGNPYLLQSSLILQPRSQTGWKLRTREESSIGTSNPRIFSSQHAGGLRFWTSAWPNCRSPKLRIRRRPRLAKQTLTKVTFRTSLSLAQVLQSGRLGTCRRSRFVARNLIYGLTFSPLGWCCTRWRLDTAHSRVTLGHWFMLPFSIRHQSLREN